MSEITHRTARFAWRCHQRGSVSNIAFEGEFDLHALRVADAALTEVLSGGPTTIVLDLGDLAYMDSAGLELLIRTKENVESRSGRMYISRHSPASKRLVELTELSGWFAPTDADGTELVPCPVCDEAISPLTPTCNHCGSAL